jgi:YegS/Rv2252/BmrU family lipid kinase
VNGPPRTLIIVNHAAARARRAWPVIRARLDGGSVPFQLQQTEKAGDATTLLRNALLEGFKLIGIVGGDGTLSEAAAGYFSPSQQDALPTAISTEARLAVLPAGTGDDFARNFAGKRAPLEDWIQNFIAHCQGERDATRLIDMIRVRTDNYQRHVMCINASTLGLGGETGARVAAQGKRLRRLSGETRFVIAAMGALAAWRERPVRVEIDGQTIIEGPMNLVAVANARFAGGGMKLSPAAEIDDGKLDVVTASGLSRTNILRELTRIHEGGHVKNPKVKIVQGRYVKIQTFAPGDAMRIEVDGNISGHTPADYTIMPGALRIAT